MNPAPLLRLTLLLGAVCAGSCAHEHSHDASAPGHADAAAEAPARQLTIWSERHEYFAEHDLCVAGEEASFAVHATTLSDGAPVLRGPLRMSFRRGEQRIDVEVEEPLRPGIFLGEVALPEAGTWSWDLELHGDSLAMPAWQIAANAAELEEIAAEVVEPEGITVLKEQQWPMFMLTAVAEPRAMATRIPVMVRVTSPPEADFIVRAQVDGVLESGSAEAWPALGASVTAGAVLGRMRVPAVGSEGAAVAAWALQREAWMRDVEQGLAAADADQRRLTLERDQALRAERRVRELAAAESASARELEEARTHAAGLSAELEAATVRLESWRRAAERAAVDPAAAGSPDAPWTLDLLAPCSGRVVESFAAPGSFHEAGAALLRVHDATRLQLVAYAPLALAGALDDATLEIVMPDGSRASLPGPLGRRLLSDAPADTDARAVPLVFTCAATTGLRSGAVLSGWVASEAPRMAL
ncbi:MAG: hypothetical protein O3A20_08205, partial [Planctomycetota bacterium]|nr:hypothetical protein [Planctomycetota bacterium]